MERAEGHQLVGEQLREAIDPDPAERGCEIGLGEALLERIDVQGALWLVERTANVSLLPL